MSNKIHLSSISTQPKKSKSKAKIADENLKLLAKLTEVQDKLFAQNKYSVLIILQGMDTAGKDSAVKHVFSGVNPAGCNVKSFKIPTEEESAHHFLWRVSKECPQRGMIKIFNRSQYEDILMPKINQTLKSEILKKRCLEINVFEKGLVDNNTILIKFLLHISHNEQVTRQNERKTNPNKIWKYQAEDAADIEKHEKYKKAYEYIIENCSVTKPWHIIPADKKWYKNYSILHTIVSILEKHNIKYPDLISE
jgi:PPK2 family polyphosphate:nucleotide phosphotransferase